MNHVLGYYPPSSTEADGFKVKGKTLKAVMKKITQIPTPSAAAVFAEGPGDQRSAVNTTFSSGGSYLTYLGYPHGDRANFVFLDGHLNSHKKSEVYAVDPEDFVHSGFVE